MKTTTSLPFSSAPQLGRPLVSALIRIVLVVAALGAPSLSVAQSALPVSVKSHGAIGDGTTDDTVAIEATVQEAAKGNGVVFFPPGEYLISRTVYLQSDMTVRGAQGAILKRPPAITQKLTKPVKKGETVAYVEDITGYQANQGFVLVDGSEAGDNGMIGRIVAVDQNEKKISFEVEGSFGAKEVCPADGKSVISTAFPILATNPTKVAISNLVIEGLTFECQPKPDEPKAYFLAPIYIEPVRNDGEQAMERV